jgi:hypothetical protein
MCKHASRRRRTGAWTHVVILLLTGRRAGREHGKGHERGRELHGECGPGVHGDRSRRWQERIRVVGDSPVSPGDQRRTGDGMLLPIGSQGARPPGPTQRNEDSVYCDGVISMSKQGRRRVRNLPGVGSPAAKPRSAGHFFWPMPHGDEGGGRASTRKLKLETSIAGASAASRWRRYTYTTRCRDGRRLTSGLP